MIVIAKGLVAGVLVWAVVSGLLRSTPTPELRDYGSFIASARAAVRGENPYGIYPLTFHVVLPGFDVWNPNLNPPVSLIAFGWWDRVEPHAGFRVWWWISLASYTAGVALLVRRHGVRSHWLHVLWAFALAGMWDTLALGQIYLPLVLAAVAAWLLLERGHATAAGILVGVIVAVKPNFLVWPVLLAAAGHVRPAMAAFATLVALWLAPIAVYGSGVYVQWFEVISSDRGRAAFLTNASLPGLLARMDLSSLGLVASALTLLALGTWALRRRPSSLHASALGLVGGIIASPIAWVHYALLLLPAFFAARIRLPILVAATLLVVPVPTVLGFLGTPSWQQVTFGSAYNWALLLCLVGWRHCAFPVHSNDILSIRRDSSATSAERSELALATSCCSTASRDSCSSS